MNTRKLSLREEVELMLADLWPLIRAAQDDGDFCQLGKLIDRRDALKKILDATTTDD